MKKINEPFLMDCATRSARKLGTSYLAVRLALDPDRRLEGNGLHLSTFLSPEGRYAVSHYTVSLARWATRRGGHFGIFHVRGGPSGGSG